MSKLKWLATIALLLACCAQVARGQCTGYTITGTSVNILSPTKAAAQGNPVVTLTISSISGKQISHTMELGIGDESTIAALNWKSQNVTSLDLYYAIDNGPWELWSHLGSQNGFNGSYPFPFPIAAAWANHTLKMQLFGTASSGATTQDRITLPITNQPPGIYSDDGIRTNAYYQLVSTFGGGSMMNQCGECQGGEIQKCLLATHTPLFDAALTNSQSGETQTLSNVQAGNVAKAQESVSGTASIMISVLPGDSPTGSTTNKIYCTMFGWVMAQQWNPGLPENEFAITELETIPSTCQLALRFFETGDSWGVQCQVAWKKPPATADRCSVVSQVPDFNPATVWDEQDCKVPGNCNTSDLPPPNGTNTNFPKYWYGASWGIRFGGPPAPGQPDPIINGGAHNWVFPIYLADAYIPGGPDEQWWILDLLNIAVAKGTGLPIDCTNRDKGTSPITSPW